MGDRLVAGEARRAAQARGRAHDERVVGRRSAARARRVASSR